MESMLYEDWLEKGKNLFGKDFKKWRFKCPACGTVQTIKDFIDVGVEHEKIQAYIGFFCIGRFTDKKGCDWTLGGLLRIHRVEVVRENITVPVPVFEFAEVEGDHNG